MLGERDVPCSKSFENTIKSLEDTSGGWVTRRDAAVALGEYAKRALAVLNAHVNEKDVDVRKGVEDALQAAGASAAPPSGGRVAARPARPAPPTMKELAQACIRKGKRAVKPDGDGFLVRVQTRDRRTQDVRIDRHKRPDTREMIRVSTDCGQADEDAIAWAIRSNSKFMYCAFCVEEREGADHITIVSNFDPDIVAPEMVKNAVKEIAYYGDWLEKKLTGEDKF